jgi:hypothetical protein
MNVTSKLTRYSVILPFSTLPFSRFRSIFDAAAILEASQHQAELGVAARLAAHERAGIPISLTPSQSVSFVAHSRTEMRAGRMGGGCSPSPRGVGAFIAGWLLPQIGFTLVGGIVAEIVNAVVGAVILLLVTGFVKKSSLKLGHRDHACRPLVAANLAPTRGKRTRPRV